MCDTLMIIPDGARQTSVISQRIAGNENSAGTAVLRATARRPAKFPESFIQGTKILNISRAAAGGAPHSSFFRFAPSTMFGRSTDAASAEKGKEEEENEIDESHAKRTNGMQAPHDMQASSATAFVSSEQSVSVEAPPRSASKLYAFRQCEPNTRDWISMISS